LVFSFVLAVPLLTVQPGCTSQTKEAILPDPDKVPQPSTMTGEMPDPAKLKRVKIK
jgi:hypothetical protein